MVVFFDRPPFVDDKYGIVDIRVFAGVRRVVIQDAWRMLNPCPVHCFGRDFRGWRLVDRGAGRVCGGEFTGGPRGRARRSGEMCRTAGAIRRGERGGIAVQDEFGDFTVIGHWGGQHRHIGVFTCLLDDPVR